VTNESHDSMNNSCLGTSSMLSGLDYDCAPPRNINDADLHADVLELPRSHGITTFTDTAYLHLAMQTIELRIRMCSLINSSKGYSALHDIFSDEASLRQHLDNIPRWSDPRALQSIKLLEIQMQGFTERASKQIGRSLFHDHSIGSCSSNNKSA
jgi:hypothetical protein